MNRHTYTAIDIAKDSLQICDDKINTNISNNPASIRKLCEKLVKDSNACVVCEATGGYERLLMSSLHEKGIAVTLVAPSRVRAFAKSEGIKAKTDPIDAKMLLKFAQEKHPKITPPPAPQTEQLVMLMDRRNQRTTDRTKEKNRLEKCSPQMKTIIEESIAYIDSEIKKLDSQIRATVASCEKLKEQSKTLQSIKGVANITAWTILTYMPEITQLDRNSIVALAGVAPFNRDSGKSCKKRRILGGRAKIRRCLFMAAKTAAIHNEHIKTYVDGLMQRGKPYKVAIVAAMRKLLIHIQSLLKKLEYA
ncbi:MAG: IS110 family transposase [Opitutales bacterium]